jgi:hypothetical protein
MLTQDYTNLQLTEEKWFSMTPEQREANVNAFDKKCIDEEDKGRETKKKKKKYNLIL